MEIISHGVFYKINKNKTTCSCDCVFIYRDDEVKESKYYKYVICPECGNEIILSELKEPGVDR